jgi:putative flippase GtrA
LSVPRPQQFLRYLVAGAVNTLATYALLVALMRVLPYLVAYTTAYVAGIALGYALLSGYVFGVPVAWRSALRFPLAYAAQYALGALFLYLLVDRLAVSPDLAAIVTVVASAPVGFLLNRLALGAR